MTERKLSARSLLDETAIHESGHAVVARALGVSVAQLTIAPEADTLGSVDFTATGADWIARAVESGIVMCAGREAARVLLAQAHNCGDDWDRERLAAIVDRLIAASPKTDKRKFRSRLLATMRSRARTLVREHSATIERVAHALLRQGHLSGAELDALIATQEGGL